MIFFIMYGRNFDMTENKPECLFSRKAVEIPYYKPANSVKIRKSIILVNFKMVEYFI